MSGLKHKLLLFFLFISIFWVSTVYAQSNDNNQVGFKLELYYDHDSPVLDLENVDASKPLILKIAVVNSYDKWIKIQGAGWGVSCRYRGADRTRVQPCYSNDDYQNLDLLVPPSTDNYHFFIILDEYNKLKPEEKLKLETIEYKQHVTPYCYDEENNFKKETLCQTNKAPINPIKLGVTAELPSVNNGGFNYDEFYMNYIVKYKELWPFTRSITAILALIATIIIWYLRHEN